MPLLYASIHPMASGDVLILATDGLQARFADGIKLGDSSAHIAQRLLAQYFKGTDDALVLVARYEGVLHE
jgi:negative regulator of sigma-B (phosphoserine phosphatase)